MDFHYVYILQSKPDPDRYYVGLTDDLKARLCKHNGVKSRTPRSSNRGQSRQRSLSTIAFVLLNSNAT